MVSFRREADFVARISQSDSFHLAECNLVLCPIVELGCPRRLMAGHLLSVLESSVVFQVNSDAGRTPGVIPIPFSFTVSAYLTSTSFSNWAERFVN